jgi:hypothetical protein
VDRVRELVLKLGGSLRCRVSIGILRREECLDMYLLLDLTGDGRVGGVRNTLAVLVLHDDRCGGWLVVD